jgi:hypothetical protein
LGELFIVPGKLGKRRKSRSAKKLGVQSAVHEATLTGTESEDEPMMKHNSPPRAYLLKVMHSRHYPASEARSWNFTREPIRF